MFSEIIEYKETDDIITDLKKIIDTGRTLSYESVSKIMVATYWNIGKRIIVFEQNGKNRAEYGSGLIDKLSDELTYAYGKGFSPRNLREYRKFYELFPDPEIWHSRVPNLTWTHFRMLFRIDTPLIREWYMNEASHENWSVRTLDRNIQTQYFERRLSAQKNGNALPIPEVIKENKLDFIKNPLVTEFLGLKGDSKFNESDLEESI